MAHVSDKLDRVAQQHTDQHRHELVRAGERERCARIAESIAAFWRVQAKEWESPKYDLDAAFVRQAAKHRADAADECALAIRRGE